MSANLSPSGSPRRIGPIRWLIAVAAIFVLLGFLIYSIWLVERRPHDKQSAVAPNDPRLTYPTPFQNVRPHVKYVGDQVCATCHQELYESYRRHPMARALAPISTARPIERIQDSGSNPFLHAGLHYGILQRRGKMLHRQWQKHPDGAETNVIEREVRFACGSGARARSYLIERDGYLFQSPITWYPEDGRWDLSPSYDKHNQHFSRVVTPGCLFCHCNYANHVPLSINHYREPIFRGFGIGCERCHGPGELHVNRRASAAPVEGPDYTIVNPARLSHALREDICYQCHLQGEQRVVARGLTDFDFRPGLPLHTFLMDFVNGRERDAEFKFVSAVEQMQASRCFAASSGSTKLGCISCHDPHRHPAPSEKTEHYRDRCLKCHTVQSCGVEETKRRQANKDDSCTACHMPRTGSEVNHAAMTDHRILRHGSKLTVKSPRQPGIAGPDDLVPFDRELNPDADPEFSRNLGVALMQMQDRGLPDVVAMKYGERALPLLDLAIARDPGDLAALQSKVGALWSLHRHDEAFSLGEEILRKWPDSEMMLHAAGNLALELNRPRDAQEYLQRAVNANPWRWQYHQGLAIAHFRQGNWRQASAECAESLRLQPVNAVSRSLLIQCLLGAGQKKKAGEEYETLRRMTPENRRESLRRWYDAQKQRFGG